MSMDKDLSMNLGEKELAQMKGEDYSREQTNIPYIYKLCLEDQINQSYKKILAKNKQNKIKI